MECLMENLEYFHFRSTFDDIEYISVLSADDIIEMSCPTQAVSIYFIMKYLTFEEKEELLKFSF